MPEVAHLIHSDLAQTTVTECDTASVTITTLDSLANISAPWRKESKEQSEEEEESSEEEEEKEEVPGMSLKPTPTVEKVVIGHKEKKAIAKAAVVQLQKSKAYQTAERLKAKKQRNQQRFREKNKQLSKKAKHMKKIGGGKKD